MKKMTIWDLSILQEWWEWISLNIQDASLRTKWWHWKYPQHNQVNDEKACVATCHHGRMESIDHWLIIFPVNPLWGTLSIFTASSWVVWAHRHLLLANSGWDFILILAVTCATHGRKCKRREVQYTAHLSQQKPTRITKTPICSHNPHARVHPCSHKPQNQTKSHGGQSAHHHRPPIQTPSISSLNSCSIATHLCICHLVHCINIPGPFFLTKTLPWGERDERVVHHACWLVPCQSFYATENDEVASWSIKTKKTISDMVCHVTVTTCISERSWCNTSHA